MAWPPILSQSHLFSLVSALSSDNGALSVWDCFPRVWLFSFQSLSLFLPTMSGLSLTAPQQMPGMSNLRGQRGCKKVRRFVFCFKVFQEVKDDSHWQAPWTTWSWWGYPWWTSSWGFHPLCPEPRPGLSPHLHLWLPPLKVVMCWYYILNTFHIQCIKVQNSTKISLLCKETNFKETMQILRFLKGTF